MQCMKITNTMVKKMISDNRLYEILRSYNRLKYDHLAVYEQLRKINPIKPESYALDHVCEKMIGKKPTRTDVMNYAAKMANQHAGAYMVANIQMCEFERSLEDYNNYHMSEKLAEKSRKSVLEAFEKLPDLTDEYVAEKLSNMKEKLAELRKDED